MIRRETSLNVVALHRASALLSGTGVSEPKLILIVSDIPDHIIGYEMALRARGIGAIVVETGGEAVAALEHQRPDCIAIDERLSDMRGWELCRAIKRNARNEVIPVIMLAHELTLEAAMHGKSVGCDAWLARPSAPDDLIRAIDDVLARHRSAPLSPQDAVVGFATCAACTSARVRAGVRVGTAQYYVCSDCGLRWRAEATGAATA
jgi:DNA-binding response OmpR family regulator